MSEESAVHLDIGIFISIFLTFFFSVPEFLNLLFLTKYQFIYYQAWIIHMFSSAFGMTLLNPILFLFFILNILFFFVFIESLLSSIQFIISQFFSETQFSKFFIQLIIIHFWMYILFLIPEDPHLIFHFIS